MFAARFVVVPAVLILLAVSPGPTAAQGPGMRPGKAVRPPRVVEEKSRVEVEIETTIGDLNRAIAETEQALTRLKSARSAARDALRAVRGEIARPGASPVPKESLYQRGILLFPEDVEKAMMGEPRSRTPERPR